MADGPAEGTEVTLDLRDRFRGCLLGLATGDAVGTTLEFKRPGSFTPITDMIGGGPFDPAPGQYVARAGRHGRAVRPDASSSVRRQLAPPLLCCTTSPADVISR